MKGLDSRQFDNSLRRQTYSLPGMLKELFGSLKQQSRELAELYQKQGIDKVILTGCGDSNAAAMAMKYSFYELSGIWAEVVPVIDLSRYYPAARLTASTLVVIISVSGNGARIEEAAGKVSKAGAQILAVTKQEDSGIGRLADQVLKMEISAFERGPGNRNYFASLLALLLLAIETGRQNQRLTEVQADAWEQDILDQGPQLEQCLPEMDRQMFEISTAWQDFVNFDFVGAGDDFVNAWIGHAKVIEAVGAFATFNNSEEWFHMNNFYRRIEQCGTLFFAAKGSPGASRTREAVQYAARIGRPVMVVTDEQPEYFFAAEFALHRDDAAAEGIHYVRVPSAKHGAVALLTHYLPSCILAGYIGAMKGERNCRGCLGPWEFAAGGEFIRNSEVVLQ